MLKLFLVLFVALAFESTGVVLMKKGMNHIGEIRGLNGAEILSGAKNRCASPHLLLGICFESIFFLCLMVLMTKSDISFLWPLTALTFIFSTSGGDDFFGRACFPYALDRRPLIILGAVFITYSDFAKATPSARHNNLILPRNNCRYPITFTSTSASRCAASLVFFCNSISAPIFHGALATAIMSLLMSRLLSSFRKLLKSNGKSSSAVSEITRSVTQGTPRSRQSACTAAGFHLRRFRACFLAQFFFLFRRRRNSVHAGNLCCPRARSR